MRFIQRSFAVIALLGLTACRRPSGAGDPGPRWMPDVRTVPSNHLKFYLVGGKPLTQGDMFRWLSLEDETTHTTIAGAFRETELWSPDGRRFTLWLHPGRQKTGVNLNEDEGPVLIEGHACRLVLGQQATTTDGQPLGHDVVLRFTVGPAEHRTVEVSRWKVIAPKAGTTDTLVIEFDRPLDSQMLATALRLDVPGHIVLNTPGTLWSFVPKERWKPGIYPVTVDPKLEDLAGNNLLSPFERDTESPLPTSGAGPVVVPVEVQ